MRGGGPITTLLINEKSLWGTIWANVIPDRQFKKHVTGNSNKSNLGYIFLWMLAGNESLIGKDALPEMVNPLHTFWGIPSRINLLFEEKKGVCEICHAIGYVVDHYRTFNKGVNYSKGVWRHSLTPYRKDEKTSKIMPMRMQAGGISYRYWLGLIANPPDSDKIMTSLPVHEFFAGDYLVKPEFRLWAFGYNVEGGQKNAKCYYDSVVPIIGIEKDKKDVFIGIIAKNLIPAAVQINYNLKKALAYSFYGRQEKETQLWRLNKQAKNPKTKSKKGENDIIDDSKDLINNIGQCFWQNTEKKFYDVIDKLKKELNNTDLNVNIENLKKDWFSILRNESIKLFEYFVESCDISEADIKHIIHAKKLLIQWNFSQKIVTNTLGLPQKQKRTRKKN